MTSHPVDQSTATRPNLASMWRSPGGVPSAPWWPLLFGGILLQLFGGVIVLASAGHDDTYGEGDAKTGGIVAGCVVGFIGLVLMLLALISLGVYLALKHHSDLARWEAQAAETGGANADGQSQRRAPRDPGLGR